MSDADTLKADYEALNNLIVNCPEFEELERLLGGFNLFQVLKFEYGEIRHSNVLAWILDPTESHGLDETFLKKWLMRVIHECPDSQSHVTAFDIDAWQLLDVEVRREWRNIDLLVILRFVGSATWVLAIENKVNSSQHSNQLTRYREIVASEFPDAQHRIHLYLTKNNEPPDDDCYIPASYAQVHRSLKECIAARDHQIGNDPKTLLENYISLLEENFMDQSKIAEIARTIYKQHRRALDVLFEHRPDNLLHASNAIRSLLAEQADDLGIIMEICNKSIVRFIPKEWAVPGNTHGTSWSGCNRTVLFEIKVVDKNPTLKIVSGGAPDEWIDPLWARAQSAPFTRQQKRTDRARQWVTLHHAGKSKLLIGEEQLEDIDDIPPELVKWCAARIKAAETREVISIIAAELPKLDKIAGSSPSA